MKTRILLLLLASASAGAADFSPVQLVEPSLQTRAGFDSNPMATSGTSATVVGGGDTLTYGALAGVGLALSGDSPAKPALKITYTGEVARFDRYAAEDFTTHRLGLIGQFNAGIWKFSGDASSLFVAGSSDTPVAASSMNADAITLWRERRRQWQHRIKLQTLADLSPSWMVRSTGTLLAYDYRTQVVAGKFAFADRADAQGAVDLGWRQNSTSLWLTGVRIGRQNQGTVPLPNCAFDYSNDYYRLATSWEGKLFADTTTVTFVAGPDFRRFTGTIDSRVFLDGRDRTSLWLEGGFSSRPMPALTLTGRVVRMDWLSSTGKAAYNDSSMETAAAWTLTPAWTMRLTAKLHRCDFFPLVRDDWESYLGAGATLKVSERTLLSADILRNHGWNDIAGVTEREFQRLVINFGATIRL